MCMLHLSRFLYSKFSIPIFSTFHRKVKTNKFWNKHPKDLLSIICLLMKLHCLHITWHIFAAYTCSFGMGITTNPCLEAIAVIQKRMTSHSYGFWNLIEYYDYSYVTSASAVGVCFVGFCLLSVYRNRCGFGFLTNIWLAAKPELCYLGIWLQHEQWCKMRSKAFWDLLVVLLT